jgi:hypothetical protein
MEPSLFSLLVKCLYSSNIAFKDRLKLICIKITEMQMSCDSRQDKVDELARHAKTESDVLKVSVEQGIVEKYTNECNLQILKLLSIREELEKQQKIAKLQTTVALHSHDSPHHQPPQPPQPPQRPQPHLPTIEDIKAKFTGFITLLIAFYASEKVSDVDFVLKREEIYINRNKIIVDTSDVRGDGACGPRAILTSFLQKCGINLPYNPFGLENYILILKECMHELLHVLSNIPANHEFLIGLFSNPANGNAVATIDEWFEIIKPNSYHFTDGDFRLVAILFGMLSQNDRITQINVLKLRPVEHNPYQSFNSFGTPDVVLPCSRDHLNIIHTGGHYRSVISFNGSIPPIFGVDALITLPH